MEGSDHGLIKGIFQEELRKITKPLRTVGVPVEIRTKRLANTCLQCCSYTHHPATWPTERVCVGYCCPGKQSSFSASIRRYPREGGQNAQFMDVEARGTYSYHVF
jgi:hypothetical protein